MPYFNLFVFNPKGVRLPARLYSRFRLPVEITGATETETNPYPNTHADSYGKTHFSFRGCRRSGSPLRRAKPGAEDRSKSGKCQRTAWGLKFKHTSMTALLAWCMLLSVQLFHWPQPITRTSVTVSGGQTFLFRPNECKGGLQATKKELKKIKMRLIFLNPNFDPIISI